MKILVIGKSGQLANELAVQSSSNAQVVSYGRDSVDILNVESIQGIVEKEQPNVIINASAYTAVDNAETDKENAFLINETGVQNLASVAKENNARFIHVSTDFAFNGESNRAYFPEQATSPIGVYGASKLAGEIAAISAYAENTTIVRTSWVYSTFGGNFVKTMLRLMAEKEQLGVVADQIGCPTYAKDLASFLIALAKQEKVEQFYHWSDLGVASWYDFAKAIQEIGIEKGLLEKSIPINPLTSEQYPTPAKRPAFSLLDSRSSQSIYQGKYWRENLALMIEKLAN